MGVPSSFRRQRRVNSCAFAWLKKSLLLRAAACWRYSSLRRCGVPRPVRTMAHAGAVSCNTSSMPPRSRPSRRSSARRYCAWGRLPGMGPSRCEPAPNGAIAAVSSSSWTWTAIGCGSGSTPVEPMTCVTSRPVRCWRRRWPGFRLSCDNRHRPLWLAKPWTLPLGMTMGCLPSRLLLTFPVALLPAASGISSIPTTRAVFSGQPGTRGGACR